ncbi:MAG: DJ-1/PfpI family protein [Alphaproteobacteria bacterium]|nr:DJ-1/PfpI family protein [Alphaproteobacteria bacterium]
MSKTVCILLAEGFEEIEALLPADIFKRLGLEVVLVGTDGQIIRGAHDIEIKTAVDLADVSAADFDALLLPGGLPGAINLRDNQRVIDLIVEADKQTKIIAAICAAPIVLHDAGIVAGRRATGYPDTERLAHTPNIKFSGKNVEVDGHIITAIGMGQAAPFAFAIAQALGVALDKIRSVAQNAFINCEK